MFFKAALYSGANVSVVEDNVETIRIKIQQRCGITIKITLDVCR